MGLLSGEEDTAAAEDTEDTEQDWDREPGLAVEPGGSGESTRWRMLRWT